MRHALWLLCLVPSSLFANQENKQSCGSLESRTHTYQITVDEKVNPGDANVIFGERTWYNSNSVYRIATASNKDGYNLVAWKSTNGRIYLTPLDENFQIAGPSGILSDSILHQIEAYEDGYASLSFLGNAMYLTRFNWDGKVIFRTAILFHAGSSKLHMGSFSFWPEANGGKGAYVVYFGVHRGGHEGDVRQMIDAKGKMLAWSGNWSWGCSHSMDMRQQIISNKIYSVCLSDNFPRAGINLNHQQRHIMTDVQQYNGFGTGILGGMALHKNHLVVGFSSTYGTGTASRDFGLTAFNLEQNNRPVNRSWLTKTPSQGENRIKIARLGDHLLALWSKRGDRSKKMQAMEFDLDFKTLNNVSTMTPKVLERDENLDVFIDSNADMTTMKNGDVFFASADREARDINIHVIKSCPSAQQE